MLHEFVESKRDEIIERTKVKVAERAVPRATEAELIYGVPLFLDQLIDTLKHHALPSDDPSDEMNASATKLGAEMLRLGFDVSQVVHDYGNVCQAVTELAFELNAKISVDEFHTLNRCLDDATASSKHWPICARRLVEVFVQRHEYELQECPDLPDGSRKLHRCGDLCRFRFVQGACVIRMQGLHRDSALTDKQ